MDSEVVLIRYVKTHRHRNDCHGGMSLRSQIPRNGGTACMPSGSHEGGPGLVMREREREDHGSELLLGFFIGKE